MAYTDPLTMADWQAAGPELARAQGAEGARRINLSHTAATAQNAQLQSDIRKKRKSEMTGDLAMLSTVIAPFALPAIGSAIAGPATTASEMGTSVMAPTAASKVGGFLSKAGTTLQPYASGLGSLVGGIAGTPTQMGAGLAGLGSSVGQSAMYGRERSLLEEIKRLQDEKAAMLARMYGGVQ